MIFRNKGIHEILGPLDVWNLQLLQHHRIAEHAYCHDVQLLSVNLRQQWQVSSHINLNLETILLFTSSAYAHLPMQASIDVQNSATLFLITY